MITPQIISCHAPFLHPAHTTLWSLQSHTQNRSNFPGRIFRTLLCLSARGKFFFYSFSSSLSAGQSFLWWTPFGDVDHVFSRLVELDWYMWSLAFAGSGGWACSYGVGFGGWVVHCDKNIKAEMDLWVFGLCADVMEMMREIVPMGYLLYELKSQDVGNCTSWCHLLPPANSAFSSMAECRYMAMHIYIFP